MSKRFFSMADITKKFIRLSKSSLSNAEKNAVIKVLDIGFLGMGLEVKKFEEELSKYFKRPSVCVINGTAALQLALQSIDVGPNDEVLVQSLTYLSCVQAISATGAKPILCDINQETLTLDYKDAEQRISKKTKAVMPVHYAGQVGDLHNIRLFAEQNNLRIIEDAAHAFGSTFNKLPVGSTGDICCFSFDAIKNITSGEGGCIVSENKSVLSRVKNIRSLGIEKDTLERFSNKQTWDFDVKTQGWRYHMSDIMASIGRVQLQRREELAEIRQYLAKLYFEKLSINKRIISILKNFDLVVPHIFPIRILNLKNRNSLRKKLFEKGIETGVHYVPNHKLTLYLSKDDNPLPETEKIHSEILTLPLHPGLNKDEVEYVCRQLQDVIE